MQSAEIRTRFLEFFRARGHEIVPSSPVVPHDDPTLLFANAGMNQFKRVFIGEERRERPRAASAQKCIRAGGKHNDLDNVGYTARHLTYFEMLGNFSFGDYFKREACEWAWELLTRGYGLRAEDLWITVYRDDGEARAVWRDAVGIPESRILGLGEKENFWAMGDVGPCGPCSELHFDRGAAYACGAGCGIGSCDCDRFLEVWNLVFMQYEQLPDGKRVPLPSPSIDTGMGLERIASVLQRKESVFDTDILRGIIGRIEELTGVRYQAGAGGTPHRVIADHVRSLAFAIADGAFPSNEDRGFVLRRILRRASRYGYKLGMKGAFIHELVPFLATSMRDAYPELGAQAEVIQRLIQGEEEQFGRTLSLGMARFEDEAGAMAATGARLFSAEAAFFLHDTCGFPIDLTEQMCRERALAVDRARFDRLMEEQRLRSRAASPLKASAEEFGAGASKERARLLGAAKTRFVGFREHAAEAKILELAGDPRVVAEVILDRTPFYAEGGGQVGDTGVIQGTEFRLRVTDTRKEQGVYIHQARLEEGAAGAVRAKAKVTAEIDGARRRDIQRNHTATHLVHAALRRVLGKHVQQKGSLVAPDRLRFDISHYDRINSEQLHDVEQLVQEQILGNARILSAECDKDEALARGALAFFGEKYGDRVRVVEIPDFSIELCGGTHCRSTGEIGGFLIVSEASVSSGVRRVEAMTGLGTLRRVREDEELLRAISGQLRAGREGVMERLASVIAENRDLKSGKGRREGARDLLEDFDAGAGEREQVDGSEIVSAHWADAPEEELLRVSDALKQRPGRRIYILASASAEGTVRVLVGTSKELPPKVVHCGEIAKAGARLVGGGGGGRPDLAQAGGKDPARLPEAIREMRRLAAEKLRATR